MHKGVEAVSEALSNTTVPSTGNTGAVARSPIECRLARLSEHQVVVGIPAYDEERNIGGIVQRIRALGFVQKVVVADDGSSDHTSTVAERAGAMVLRHERNLGAGAATRTCFDAAVKGGATILVTLDGDGQHDPDEIPYLLLPIAENTADIVIGSRFLRDRNDVPMFRKLGINVITLLCNLGSGVGVSDSQSCFRAYSDRALRCLSIKDEGFGFSVETLVQARRKKLRIAEVPISCIYNSASHTISPLVHGPSVALAVLKHRVALFVKGLIGGRGGRDGVPSSVAAPRVEPFGG